MVVVSRVTVQLNIQYLPKKKMLREFFIYRQLSSSHWQELLLIVLSPCLNILKIIFN